MSWSSFGFKSYQEYLNHWTWKEKRDFMLKRFPICQECHKEEATEVHHKTYESVCNEGDKDLLCLCKGCHEKIHKKEEKNG